MRISGVRWRLGHRPGLDGLRGIAVALVVLAHLFPKGLPVVGGLNTGSGGVTMFFALSGFLITSLLITSAERRGRPGFRQFYARRVRRLAPALAAYLAFWVALSVLGIGPFHIAVQDVAGSLFYVTNWRMAANLATSHPIGITWSLSVEEQFYLLWPLTFLAIRRWPALPLTTAILGIITAFTLRVVAWAETGNGWAIYHRTDTRMDSLLVGCVLAIVLHRSSGTRLLDPGVARLLGWGGAALVAGAVALETDWANLVALPFVVALGTCGVIVACLDGRFRWLEVAPLRWLGRRSYALYLWHYPILALTWPEFHVLPVWSGLPLALVAAEASWWVVERPFRKRGEAAAPMQARATSAEAHDAHELLSPGVRPGLSTA